jgi:hypothetical protein
MTEFAVAPDAIVGGDVAPTKTVRATFYIIYMSILALLFVGGAELVLRAKGIRPWRADGVTVPSIHVEPGEKFFQTHPALGYSHIPGRFNVTLGLTDPSALAPGHPDHLRFTVTHLPNTLRITHPVDRVTGESGKPELWIFGCSFTHGWSVNDDETYPWLLQQRLPEFNVVNFGVSGYGTIHSLLQFREALKTKTPKVALLAYAGFHDERNTFARSRRKAIVPWNKLGPVVQPYARFDSAGRLQYFVSAVVYPEFPLMRHLALSHFLEIKYDEREPTWLRSHQVSEALIGEMATLARASGVTFGVAIISDAAQLDLPVGQRVPIMDIRVDFKRPENTNLPFDAHPSRVAHVRYADKLEGFLKTELALKQP